MKILPREIGHIAGKEEFDLSHILWYQLSVIYYRACGIWTMHTLTNGEKSILNPLKRALDTNRELSCDLRFLSGLAEHFRHDMVSDPASWFAERKL